MQTTYYSSSYQTSSPSRQGETIIRSSLQTIGGENRLVFSSFTDIEGAKAAARRLFDTYDRDRDGNINNAEVVPMISNLYRSFNRNFTPSKGDVDAYFRVLDRNKDGRVNLQDIEALCIKYLVGGQLESFEVRKEVFNRGDLTNTNEDLQKLEAGRRLKQYMDNNQMARKDDENSFLMKTFGEMGILDFDPNDKNTQAKIELAKHVMGELKKDGYTIDENTMRIKKK